VRVLVTRQPPRLPRLTPREIDCLRAYAETGDYRAAAERIGIGESTMRSHLAKARRRLDVQATVVAVWKARRLLTRSTRVRLTRSAD
jgi:DNA-binding CsgD family transcriptional regulator